MAKQPSNQQSSSRRVAISLTGVDRRTWAVQPNWFPTVSENKQISQSLATT